MSAEINDKRLEIKKIAHEVEEIKSKAKDASHIIKSMLKKYDWIHEETFVWKRKLRLPIQ